MSKIDDGGPAFPGKKVSVIYPDNLGKDVEKQIKTIEFEGQGMSLRDYFAGQVLSGFVELSMVNAAERVVAISQGEPAVELDNKSIACSTAEFCYSIADAMIAASKESSDEKE